MKTFLPDPSLFIVDRRLLLVHLTAFITVYLSDGQTTARGPDAARLEVLSGPRQILK